MRDMFENDEITRQRETVERLRTELRAAERELERMLDRKRQGEGIGCWMHHGPSETPRF